MPGEMTPPRTERPRGGNGQIVPSIETAERDMRAAVMRSRSMSWQHIADALGFASPSGAYQAAQRAWRLLPTQELAEAMQIELTKLDFRERTLFAIMSREHIIVDRGRIIRDADGNPLIDDDPVIRASNALTQTQRHRSRLLGLDAPARRVVNVITEEVIDREIRRLDAELEGLLGTEVRMESGEGSQT